MSPNTIFKIVALGLMCLSSSLALGPEPVALGAAGGFAILAQTGVSTVPQSVITGNVGLYPADSAGLTGFSMTSVDVGANASSTQVVGKLMASDFVTPSPENLLTSVKALSAAFSDASSRPVTATNTNLGAGSIGGLILEPGVYKWTSAVNIETTVTLNGTAHDTWIFQLDSTLLLANGISVALLGGALPENIVWVVAGAVTLGSTSTFQGILLGGTMAALNTGATVNGRLLVGTAVTLQSATINAPA